MPSIYNIKRFVAGLTYRYGINIDGNDSATYEKSGISWDFPDASHLHLVITDATIEGSLEYTIPIINLTIQGINYADQATVDAALKSLLPADHTGGTVPAILRVEVRDNKLYYFFLPGDMSFLSQNPEIFLFRQSKQQGLRKDHHTVLHGQRWIHTADRNRAAKWAGWKYFNGTTTVERDTEFVIPDTIKPYERQLLADFNNAIYRVSPEGYDVVSDETYTVNDFLTRVVKLTGSNQRKGTWAPAMVLQFILVLAVDNILATKENGLCPKNFIGISDSFYTFPAFRGNTTDGTGIANIRIGKDVRKSKNRLIHA